MVVQKTINNLKDRPKEERQVVAVGAAGIIVLILLVGWAFFFLKSIRREQSAIQSAVDIPQDGGAAPVQQTGTTYDSFQGSDQFGRPSNTADQ